MERIVEEYGFDGRALTWLQLGHEAGIEASWRTIQRAMGTLNYRKCIACKKGWQSPANALRRVKWAKKMLQERPYKEDWRDVRFSDEVHFGWGPTGTLRIIRKPGQRECPDCIQHAQEPKEKDQKTLHYWAAVGYNFKSPMVEYNSGNKNGKMTQDCYIQQILKAVVKPWLDQGHVFTLEEDGDSGHGPGHFNKART